MAKRYIGDAVVTIKYVGTDRDGRDEYVGTIRVENYAWKFSSLYAPAVGFGAGVAYDSPAAYDSMAKAAVSFGSYYTTCNRGDDVPDWAPDAETADAIDAAAWDRDESGEYSVSRKPVGLLDRASRTVIATRS